ncbi:MAG: filamentous hemagglutinin N-terminal domain-containing protein, partial [Parachlamydiales bacterium]
MKNLLAKVFFGAVAGSSTLFALPQGHTVVAGQAEFSSQENKLTVLASDQAIINYQTFNLREGEKIEFVQPSVKACLLNRVVGGDISRLLGEIRSNGRIFLVNPQGIYFGREAVVNVGSLVASTLNIKDEDFLAGNYRFFLEPGAEKAKIVNEGKIASLDQGFIGLFAPIIENRGPLLAKAEKIILASAE